MAEESRPEAQAEGLSQANGQSEANGKAVYEIGFHVLPTVAEAQVGAVVERVRAELQKFDAEIIKEEFPHKVTLTYTIERSASGKREKFNEAYFGFIKFATEPANVPAFEAALRGIRDVLRFIVVHTVREDAVAPRRAIYTSDRLEGETIQKPTAVPEKAGEVSEEELNKSIDALVNPAE